jgi:hypothetical protein
MKKVLTIMGVVITLLSFNATATERLTPSDKQGAWEMYVELTTKDATPILNTAYRGMVTTGVWETALVDIHSIFPRTRETLKSYGSDGSTFAKLAISLINHELAPFITKWRWPHRKKRVEFTTALQALQSTLDTYIDKFEEMYKEAPNEKMQLKWEKEKQNGQ